MNKSFQEQGSVMHCFGCGADNPHGYQIKSYWDGDDAIAEFEPKPFHCGGAPEIVYGGLLASLIDCHSCNLAIAQIYKNENRPIGSDPFIRCVTAQLNISFVNPTNIDETIYLKARVKSSEGRKIWVDCEIFSAGKITVRGEVLVIQILNKS